MRRFEGFWISGAVVVASILMQGCERNVALAERTKHKATVRSVTHYGMTLDKEAVPEKVAFVLLRAIKEDFEAKTTTDRDAALDKQFDVAAATVIGDANRTGLTRDEYIQDVVLRWTPTASHYVDDIGTDWETIRTRFRRSTPRPFEGSSAGAKRCEVFIELADPDGDPNAHVILVVRLVQDQGFWRATHLQFDTKHRSLSTSQASPAPASKP